MFSVVIFEYFISKLKKICRFSIISLMLISITNNLLTCQQQVEHQVDNYDTREANCCWKNNPGPVLRLLTYKQTLKNKRIYFLLGCFYCFSCQPSLIHCIVRISLSTMTCLMMMFCRLLNCKKTLVRMDLLSLFVNLVCKM